MATKLDYRMHDYPADRSILEPELRVAASLGRVSELRVFAIEGGYRLEAIMRDAPRAPRFISTRRRRDEPRVFASLERLAVFLRQHYPESLFPKVAHLKAGKNDA